jgi:hypothetical protein
LFEPMEEGETGKLKNQDDAVAGIKLMEGPGRTRGRASARRDHQPMRPSGSLKGASMADSVTANITELRPPPKAKRQRNSGVKSRKRQPIFTVTRSPTVAPAAIKPAIAARKEIASGAALVVAVMLAAVSGFFGVTGMTAIFAAAAVAVMVMTGVLEAAKLVTAAWLARHWRDTSPLLRLPLVVMVLLLMALTAVGTFGFLSRAHLDHQVAANESVDRDAAPIAQGIALAEAAVRDLDSRIAQLDDMVKIATARGRTKVAMALVNDQSRGRGDLVAQRRAAAERLSDLRVELAGIEARRSRVASESGPALYLAKLFGSDNTEGMVRLITALLVLVLDPLAVLLTIAASRQTR